jgi:hypothetical protein
LFFHQSLGSSETSTLLRPANEEGSNDSDLFAIRSRAGAQTNHLLTKKTKKNHPLIACTLGVEMSYMAELFFPKIGVTLFYICIVIYLFGDLCICLFVSFSRCFGFLPLTPTVTCADAVAVPKSLQQATCASIPSSNNNSSSLGLSGTHDHCFGSFSYADAYYLYLGLFALLLGPFCFFNVQKTKPLQVATSLVRWTTFTMMIVIAIVGIARGEGFTSEDPRPPAPASIAIADFGNLKTLFGVSIYSFMCHHRFIFLCARGFCFCFCFIITTVHTVCHRL